MYIWLYLSLITISVVFIITSFKRLKILTTQLILILLFLIVLDIISINFILRIKPKIILNHFSQQKLTSASLVSARYYEKKYIVVGTSAKIYPWVYKKHGKLVGLQHDLLVHTIKLMKKEAKFKVMPRGNLIKALSNNEIDIISDLTPINIYSKFNQNLYSYSPPYAYMPSVFFGYKHNSTFNYPNGHDITSLLSNHKMVTTKDSIFARYLQLLGVKDHNLIEVNSSKDLINMIISKKGSLVGLTELFTIKHYINNHPKSNLVIYHLNHAYQQTMPLTGGIAFVTNKNSSLLTKQLSHIIQLELRKGFISRLSIKYFNYDITP